MADDNRLNTNYKYSISLLYMKDNVSIEIKSDKIMTATIEYDYMKKNMPIILMRMILDKKLIDHMIANKNKTIVLTISKFKESQNSTIKVYKKFIRDEFFYFLDNNMNYLEDLDYGNTNKDSEDITKIITVGLIKKDTVLNNKVLINTVYNDTSLLDIICSRFNDTGIVIEPFKNKHIDNLIVTPIETLSKFIAYLDNQFTLYDTSYRLFFDFNKSYLLSSSGKGIETKDEKYNTIFINVNNSFKNESKVEGMREDKDNKAYIVYVDSSNINISVDDGTTISYNEIIGVDSDGNSKIVNLNSNLEGDRYKVTRLTNNNLDKLDNIKHNIDSGNTVINIIKEQLDSEIFTMNKEYYIKNYDKLSDKNGRYILIGKKELYMKEVDDFHMTSILTLKKCP